MSAVLAALLIALTGDSHALGDPGRELAQLLRARGHQVVVTGRIGATSGSAPWVQGVDAAVMFIGSNEFPSPSMVARYRRLRAIIVGPPASARPQVQAVARLLDAGMSGRRYISSLRCTDRSRSIDGLHYSGAAAKRWAACIFPEVLRLVEDR